MLAGKNIVIGITGSIAAYKIPFLVRLLVKEKANVRIVLTPAAKDFVTPLTLSTLSGEAVISQPFDPVDGSWNSHVDLGNWADLLLIAPVSANTMGKMANGIADNFLLTVYLSAKCPVYFAPAMDLDMFKHTTTQKNVKKLQEMGNILIEPQVGELASGLSGAGRMEEPEEILQILKKHFNEDLPLKGNKILVTAGPTYEAIDPVRFVSNPSSGKMGYAVAKAAADRGGDVVLVSGPTALNVPFGVERVDVISAAEMAAAVFDRMDEANVIVKVAAVSDYKPVDCADHKIKKGEGGIAVEMSRTTDILAELGRRKNKHQVLVGFAAETQNLKENALEKLKKKNLDIIAGNLVCEPESGFCADTNRINLFFKDGTIEELPVMDKSAVAHVLLDRIKELN